MGGFPIVGRERRLPRLVVEKMVRRPIAKILAVLGFVALAVAAMAIVYLTAPTAATSDLARSKATEKRLFVATIAPEGGEPTVGPLASWTLELRYPDGRPVENARVAVDGGMPEHDHGLPTRPTVSAGKGDGRYRIDGLKFSMPGQWVLRFDIAADDGTDRVTFNILL
jgi:hypothetical protein